MNQPVRRIEVRIEVVGQLFAGEERGDNGEEKGKKTYRGWEVS